MIKKKHFIWIIASVILIIVFIIPRCNFVRTKIAYSELENSHDDSVLRILKGPIVSEDNERNYTDYIWYYKLAWGDSAKIYFSFSNSVFSNTIEYYIPKVTMNYQWYYLQFPNGTSKFYEIVSKCENFGMGDYNDFSIFQETNYSDSIMKLLYPNRLLFYLKKGYFEIEKQEKDFSDIKFYEPYTYIFKRKDRIDTVYNTMTAKVYIDSCKYIHISPR